jgi:hypothetical protein
MTTLPWLAPPLMRQGEIGQQWQTPMSSAPGDGSDTNVIVDHMQGHQPVKPQQTAQRNASRYLYTINESPNYQEVFTRAVLGLFVIYRKIS